MRAMFAAELRALPAPKGWKRHGESPWGSRWEDVRAAWRDLLIDASEADYRTAHAAYRRCVELAVSMQSFDEHARRCAASLERSFPTEHPRLDELLPRGTYLASGIDTRLDPLPDPRALGGRAAAP
jgi:hypothetical protein